MSKKKVKPKFRVLSKVVAERFGINRRDLVSGGSAFVSCRPRAVLCYIAVRHFKFGLSQLGMMMDKDHTTILHSVRMAKKLDLVPKEFVQEIVQETVDRSIAEAAFHKEDLRRFFDERQSV